MKIRDAVLVGALAASPACHQLTPAGFWTTYREELISKQFSEQGPWGGTRWVVWTSTAPDTFEGQDVIDFARKNGWSCEAARHYSADELRRWQYLGRPVFPLHFSRASHAPDNADVQQFPRHISDASVVFPCRTGWSRVQPGTGTASDALGYIQINESGTQMAVYHLWGET